MSWLSRHPGLRSLTRYVDGEAGLAETREVQAHLSSCQRCRGELRFVLEVRRAAREISHPSPPKGTLEEILRRRAAGERVILPMSTPPARRAAPGLAGLILLFLVIGGVALGLLFGPGRASAGANSLRLGPERPQLGQPIDVEFHAASPLAGAERVVLRGRYRTAESDPIGAEEPLGAPFHEELEPAGGGVFTGTAWLPPTAVYTAFVVESADGSRQETDAGRPWEVLAHDAEGRPVFAALVERFRVMEALHRREAMLETARRMTELYPEEPEGWWLRLRMEKQHARAGPGTLEAEHRKRLPWLEQVVSRLDKPGGDRLAALAAYARSLNEKEIAEFWERRLLEEYPRHRRVQQARIVSIVAAPARPSSDPGEHLRAFELEWDRAGAMDPSFLRIAFARALEVGDPDLARRWAERYARFHPVYAPWVVESLLKRPEYRELGMEWARALLARLERPGSVQRRLLHSSEEHRRVLDERRRSLLAEYGRALVEEDRREAALDTLRLAAAGSWMPGLVRELAPLLVTAGDTAGGLELFGMAAADPVADADIVRTAAGRVLGHGFSDRAWEELVAAARTELRRRVAAAPARRPWRDGPIHVWDPAGAEVDLEARLEGRLGLLVLWTSGHPGLEEMVELTHALERVGVQATVLWTDGVPTDREAVATGSALLDSGREASEAFGAWVRPWYVVVDEEGLIRYEGGDPDDAFRYSALLAGGPTGAP